MNRAACELGLFRLPYVRLQINRAARKLELEFLARLVNELGGAWFVQKKLGSLRKARLDYAHLVSH